MAGMLDAIHINISSPVVCLSASLFLSEIQRSFFSAVKMIGIVKLEL